MSKVQAGGGLREARLRVTELDVMRGGRRVIAGLSFELAGGNALVLTGPNGAGKTTLIRALAGLLPIDRGSVRLEHAVGTAGTPPEPAERAGEHCHYIGHVNAAKPNLTVYENLSFWARFLGGSGADAWAAIDALDLDVLSDIPVGYLSAGQQRRVAIARLLVAERPIWLLDEPTVSLDAANSARLVGLGNAHLASGGMIIAATHLLLAFEPAAELRLQPGNDVLGEADAFAGVVP